MADAGNNDFDVFVSAVEAAEGASDQKTQKYASSISYLSAPPSLGKAIETLSSNAAEGSLLSNPLNAVQFVNTEVPEIGPFVDPLTIQERALWNQSLGKIQAEEAALNAILTYYSDKPADQERARRDFPIQVSLHENNIKVFQALIVPIANKFYQALAEYQAAVAAREVEMERLRALADVAAAEQQENNQVINEFAGYVDTFSQVKKSLPGARKYVASVFERSAREYVEDEPHVIFVSEYFVDEEFVGLLVCFEQYRNSTHYEVFKRNVFGKNANFRRILFLDSPSLEKELDDFLPYVHEALGLGALDREDVFIILDTNVQQDRIYEYTVSADKVPTDAREVDYDLILELEDKLVETDFVGNRTLFSYSKDVLEPTNGDFAWLIALVNEFVTFFGRATATQPLSQRLGDRGRAFSAVELDDPSAGYKIFVPKAFEDVLNIYRESVNLFGVERTFSLLLNRLGGLPGQFSGVARRSLDEESGLFSYDSFRSQIESIVPVVKLITEIVETGDPDALNEVEQAGAILPMNEGTENVTTILGLTNVINYMNNMFLTVTNAQDNATFERLVNVRALIELNRKNEDSLETASALAQDRALQAIAANEATVPSTNLYEVAAGTVAVSAGSAESTPLSARESAGAVILI
jgi:hypothetical protein